MCGYVKKIDLPGIFLQESVLGFINYVICSACLDLHLNIDFLLWCELGHTVYNFLGVHSRCPLYSVFHIRRQHILSSQRLSIMFESFKAENILLIDKEPTLLILSTFFTITRL